MKRSFWSSIYLFLFFVLSLFGIYFFGEEKIKSFRKPYYFAPPEVIRYFTFGYNDIYADLLWVRYIQSADFCSFQKGVPVYDGETKHQCHKGWAYHMAHAITELAPRFQRPYIVSGVMLGVLMGDKEGARIILDKAVKQFPEDWKVLFHAGNHYLIELNEPEQAAEYLLGAAKKGGPLWLYSLSAKLYSRAGRLDVAERLLQQIIEDDPNSVYINKFKGKLKEIQKEKQAIHTEI